MQSNHMNKKALIVSPYFDHLGGGERYMLAAGSALESLGYEVYFSWDNLDEIGAMASMLGIDLHTPKLDSSIKNLYFSHNPLKMYLATKAYDVVFYLSDGSLPLLGARRNILHMQVPFHSVGGKSLKNALKKPFISAFVVNSHFTKQVVDAEFGFSSTVLYPPVVPIPPGSSKENLILSVGRFEPSLNTKHQDVLIESFAQLAHAYPDWKLVLAGGSSSEKWMAQLKGKASGLKVEFVPDAKHSDLVELYQKARLYWHAAGYAVDETKNPELTEHFGISTVEAISAGCTPLVVPYGGQREIVTDPALHWRTIDELLAKTKQQISAPRDYIIDISPYLASHFATQLAKLVT